MAALPDTPGNSPGRQKDGPRERSVFNLGSHDGDGEGTPHSAGGYDRPDQTVFDLTMDYSDDDTLLDWEQYAGMRKFKCWGMDCSLVARFCPFMPCIPPEWYYRYSRRQRRMMKTGFILFGVLLGLLVAATVLISLLPNQDSASTLGLANAECSWASYHLPDGLRPTQYDLDMAVELEEPFDVTGSVQIHANITKASKCIVLHAVAMNITHASRLEPHADATWSFNDQEQVILRFEEAIRPPSALIALHFNYTLRKGLSGFYRSTYNDSAGGSQVMATTQMEANSARKAFPCFDEPHLKAVWNVSMTAPSPKKVLFNTREASSEGVGNSTKRRFEVTPPMSSYLVAFVVGNLTSVSTTVPYPHGTAPERQLSVWGTPDRLHQLEDALQIASVVLPTYESLFGVPYPLPKLDLVAIPDFAAGAMENWGLITYRETALLYSPQDSSIANARRVALVIAHEMVHMWFGDLVTMKDWGELWLNEGFATYFENVGASVARPNFAYFDTFYSDFGTSAMGADALSKSTHPLATLTGMDTAEKVEAMFDDISYDKGGSVLRMLRAYLNRNAAQQPLMRRSLLQQVDVPTIDPNEVFLKGLQQYLAKHSYNNTSSNDLWAEMDAVTGQDVTGWMRAWTFQPGFPRVQILLEGPTNTDLAVYQAPFEVGGVRRCDDTAKGIKANNAPWWIPIASFTRENRAPSWKTLDACLMDGPLYIMQDENDWIKLNAGQYGLYRVNYPNKLWSNLAAAAAEAPSSNVAPAISAQDLAGLLDDAWALAQAGETPLMNHLDLIKSLARRTAPEYAPWSVASGPMVMIGRLMKLHRPDPSCADRWTAFARDNVTAAFLARNPQLALNATAPNASAQTDVQPRLLRPLLLSLAAEFGDPTVTSEVVTLFTNSSNTGEKPNADIRGTVYSVVVRSGVQSNYDAIKQFYLTAIDASEKARALGALGFASTPELREATLEFSLSADVRSQDTSSLITQVAYRGGDSLQAAWSFVRNRYNDISEKLGGIDEAASKMGKLLRNVASGLASEEAIQEIDAVFDAHKNVLTEPRFREGAKESVRTNMEWLRRNGLPLCEWLGQQ